MYLRINRINIAYATLIIICFFALVWLVVYSTVRYRYMEDHTCEEIFKNYPGLLLEETPTRCLIEKSYYKNPDALRKN